VHNISLNGIANGTTQDVVIHCNRSGGVLMININHLTISNISIQECNNGNSHLSEHLNIALVIKYCKFVTVYQINVSSSTILGINILGDSYFSYVTCDGMELLYFEEKQFTKLHNTISIDHYHHSADTTSLLLLTTRQNYYQIVLKLSNINEINLQSGSYIFYGEDIQNSEVIITNCNFLCNVKSHSSCCGSPLFYFDSSEHGVVHFEKCRFLVDQESKSGYDDAYITAVSKIIINITNCNFSINDNPMLRVFGSIDLAVPTTVVMNNTTVSSSPLKNGHLIEYLILVSYTRLMLTGTVIFYNINVSNSIVLLTHKSYIVVDGIVCFINNSAFAIVNFQHNNHEYIMLNETSVLNINQNYLCTHFYTAGSDGTNPYPYCFFQYFSSKNLDSKLKCGNFSIALYNNHYDDCNIKCIYNQQNVPTTNCQWLPQSSFNTTLPLDVNDEYIQYTDSTGTYNRIPHVYEPNTLCICTNVEEDDCSITDLGFVYPGQTLTIPLHYSTLDYSPNVIVSVVDQIGMPLCRVLDGNQYQQIINNQSLCTRVKYTNSLPY